MSTSNDASSDQSRLDSARGHESDDHDEYVEFEAEGTGLTLGKVLIGALVLSSFGVWAYAFSGFADRTPPDQLANETYLAVAEPRCAAAMVDYESLPNALDVNDNVERSGLIDDGTVILADMVDDLEASLQDPGVDLDERDDGITREWLADWRRYLADRTDFSDRFAVDPEAVFYVAASDGGERLERRITRFANTNRLFSCVTPSDIG